MTMTTELVELAPCICGAVVDQDECPYPSGRDLEPGTGRQAYVVNCTNENCGWQCLGWGADGARKAWNTRALASRAGGWLPIESAPTKQRVLVCGGDTPNGTAIATCDPGRYTPWHESHDELPMVRSWYADTMSGRSIWPHPTHWQPLPAAPEPLAVGSNNLSSDEEEAP